MDFGYSLTIRQKAQREIDEAFDWYEKRSLETGKRFLIEVKAAVELITQHPQIGMIYRDPIRRKPLTRFPFQIVYALRDSSVEIIAVWHTSRDPDGWEDRL